MSDTAAIEKTPLASSPSKIEDGGESETNGCCCLLVNYKDIPKSLRFPVGVLRWNIVASLIIFSLNIYALYLCNYERGQYNGEYFCDFILSFIHLALWTGLDTFGNYLLSKALIYGDKKCFIGFKVELSIRIVITLFAVFGIPCTGFAGLIAAVILDERSVEASSWCSILIFVWCSSFVILLYGIIHVSVAVKKLGGIESLTASSCGEMSTSINTKYKQETQPDIVISA